MAWKLTETEKYQLPDGSIFVVECWLDTAWPSPNTTYGSTHETKVKFEINKGNWVASPLFIEDDQHANAYTTWQFEDSKTGEIIPISLCKKIASTKGE